MTIFEKIKNMNIDELAEAIDSVSTDIGPWTEWFDSEYCKKCENIKRNDEDGRPHEYAFCELNDNCRYFKDSDGTPDNVDVIKMWLTKEADDNENA